MRPVKGGAFEIPLVAEGFRKLGTVSYLLANGTLARQSILFWDEPETNLNPAYMVKLAELLVAIARNGTQVIVATHSLFCAAGAFIASVKVGERKRGAQVLRSEPGWR
ncbi:MAG: ATP-binding protein [Verrucomicrobiales bacterium]|nr:ATP-binding protein [Verrucomicrobiales bacterium]